MHIHVHYLNYIIMYLKDQQIDAKELQGCLTSSGISGSYHRKYDFMDFMH